jgi:NAD+ synthase
MKTKAVIDYIVDWLEGYCDNAGLEGFVAGVSGGIDSAVTSALCARTGKDVILLNMPIFQPVDSSSLSARHISRLEEQYPRVSSATLDLTPAFRSFEDVFPDDLQDGLTMANTRSRIRMITLYAFATHHRMLVAGTGNKVEDFGVGFYTKYGDGGVDISPIADLMKSEVYELGRELGVLDAILTAPPSDGLWEDNRSDETQIGATYDELEWAMRFEAGSDEENRLNDRQKKVLTIYRHFHRANRHKMDPIPVCIIPASMK